MNIPTNTKSHKGKVEPSLLDIVSLRSSQALFKANQNSNAIKSDESAIRNNSTTISNTNARLSEIEPCIQTKLAYIGDTVCEFDKGKGNITSVSCLTESGKVIPTEINVTNSNIIVSFASLDEVAEVTVITQ